MKSALTPSLVQRALYTAVKPEHISRCINDEPVRLENCTARTMND